MQTVLQSACVSQRDTYFAINKFNNLAWENIRAATKNLRDNLLCTSDERAACSSDLNECSFCFLVTYHKM